MYVYILSDHRLTGAEHMAATLDRTRLPALIERKWPGEIAAYSGLSDLLSKTDDALAANSFGWDCALGWGGVQLHVVQLCDCNNYTESDESMSNVIILEPQRPHISGECICIQCHHTWNAVTPIGTTWLECPKCGLRKGAYKHPTGATKQEERWQCSCECDVFWITRDGFVCCLCGTLQVFGEIE